MLRVLVVLGAYHPDIGGGGTVQCREVVRTLRPHVQFTILATTSSAISKGSTVDGVPISYISLDARRVLSKVLAAPALLWKFWVLCRRCDIVHFYGFSQKNVPLTLLAKGLGKRVILSLYTAGHDEPEWVRRHGWLSFRCYTKADRFVGATTRLGQLLAASGLDGAKYHLIPCGVDVEQFFPAETEQRAAIKRELGLPPELPMVLFVGFFSQEKSPDVLFEAWARLQEGGAAPSVLVLIGATQSRYFEVDPSLGARLRDAARRRGLESRVRFIERAPQIELFFRCADVFALPSRREEMPVALLEAMASGLPCVVSRLPGATDAMIEDGIEGLLVPPGDVAAWSEAVRWVLEHPDEARVLGRNARRRVQQHYAIDQTAARYLAVYQAIG